LSEELFQLLCTDSFTVVTQAACTLYLEQQRGGGDVTVTSRCHGDAWHARRRRNYSLTAAAVAAAATAVAALLRPGRVEEWTS